MEDDATAEDLRTLVTLALARAGSLLTAGEARIAQRIVDLEGDAATIYARLTARVPEVFALDRLTVPRVADPAPGLAALAELDLIDGVVLWRVRAHHLPRAELAAAARRLGLPVSGRKADLVARLTPHQGWHPARWIRLRHRGLLARLTRWAFLRPSPDRNTLVVARLGVVQWPEYALTRGPSLHADRRQLLRWEAARTAAAPEAILGALSRSDGVAPGRLDLSRPLRRRLREAAHALESVDPTQAAALYTRAVAEGGESLPRIAFRWARAEEAAGRPAAALSVLRRARRSADPAQALAISRAGSRIARKLGGSWAPDPPLRSPRRRRLRLPMDGEDPAHSRWGAARTGIEAAVCQALADVGRRALHGEGRPFTTLFALLFAETYFLPVDGALPTRFLSGPVDLWTPRFASARSGAIASVLDEIRSGGAGARVARAHAHYHGVRLSGARWDVADLDTLVALADGLGPDGVLAVVEALLREGRRGAAGLPDLTILPGPATQIDGCVPTRVASGILFAEIKGPTDQLRDAQVVWLDRLLRCGVPAEVWEVRGAPP